MNTKSNISKKLNSLLLLVSCFCSATNAMFVSTPRRSISSGAIAAIVVVFIIIGIIVTIIKYSVISSAISGVRTSNGVTTKRAVAVSYPTTANQYGNSAMINYPTAVNQPGCPNNTYPPQQGFVGYTQPIVNEAQGSMMLSPPLDRKTLESYAKVRLSEALQIIPSNLIPESKASDGSIECLCCFKKISKAQYTRLLPCNHIFHLSCIDSRLLNQNGNCPLCFYNLNTNFVLQQPQQFPDNHLNHNINVQ
ncbi:hypothetical protein BB559_005803 [Furculomyces boomerangus]|uniref:RING-type domain-containing protein n=2 Tax=Harpellales TaxID=61421 RepID=A0A2T9Y6G9_9FUNG|nr:hypothetical protein BB559_005803 [Furculomyces boomerangus]PVZ97174.1 hypothetical protein BB558_006878 [Smittium angustum]